MREALLMQGPDESQDLVRQLEHALVVDYEVVCDEVLQGFVELLRHHALVDGDLQLNETRSNDERRIALHSNGLLDVALLLQVLVDVVLLAVVDSDDKVVQLRGLDSFNALPQMDYLLA